MKTNSTLRNLLIAIMGIILISGPAVAQWENLEPMDSLPVLSPWRSRDLVLDFSQIIPDPEVPGNNLLYINDFRGLPETRGTYRYDWRLNLEKEVPPEECNEEKGITVVFRAKPTTEAIHSQEFSVWWFISIRASGTISFQTNLQMKKDTLEFQGSDAFFPGGPSVYHQMIGDTNWHTYRVTQLKQAVKVYKDENPTPIFDGKTYGTDPGANHMRIGKDNRNSHFGGMYDYFLILEGAIYAPGQGPAIPEGYIIGPDAPSSVFSPAAPGQISVYPNPAGESITLSFMQKEAGMAQVDIYSLTGQKLMSAHRQHLPAGSQEIRIRTGELATGIYLLSVNGEYTRFIKK